MTEAEKQILPETGGTATTAASGAADTEKLVAKVETEAEQLDNLKTKGTELEGEQGFWKHFYIHLPEKSSGWTRYIRDFFTCLEFLTQLQLTRRDAWFPDEFARSVKFFPVIGLIIGFLMTWIVYAERWAHLPQILSGVLLLVAELFFIGSLMYDGFMDTCDGLFSGRNRARKLEIMQDSHVGANAVIGVIVLLMTKAALFMAMPQVLLPDLVLVMYVATRTFMVLYIIHFPNARPGGLGAMFKNGATTSSTVLAFVLAALFIYLTGPQYFLPVLAALVLCLILAWYIKVLLGGLTGDTFGFLTECGDVLFLFSALVLYNHNILR
jgi:adenosylcobinamide-GDP ribazoletransferase